MNNAVELDGMDQQHVAVDQHVHLEMLTIGNAYHQENRRVQLHPLQPVVVLLVQRRYHMTIVIGNQV